MKKLVVLGGPTASGKTKLAIELAKHWGTSVLSADSRQCYREMSIGTAVPSEEELNTVPHYFIHTHSIHDTVNAATFEQYALNVLDSLFSEHDIVVCTGGTGLYIQALINGIDPMPETPESVRVDAETAYKNFGLNWLQLQVAQCDPVLFERIDQQNVARLLRAYSFYLANKQPLSQFQQNIPKKRYFETALFCLVPQKDVLHERINKRVDTMMLNGLWQEAEALYSAQHLKALQTVGYRELFEVMNHKLDLQEAIAQIKTHTRQYAKRQLTWFKHQTQAHCVSPENALTTILTHYRK